MQSVSNKHLFGTYGKKHLEDVTKPDRRFWGKEPVPKAEDLVKPEAERISGPVEKKTIDEIPKENTPLPDGYEWSVVDMTSAEQCQELFQLLYDHYVEDDDGYFRFKYGIDFLKWALTPPGYEKDLLISIRETSSKNMVAFIAGVFINIKVRPDSDPVGEGSDQGD